jgi:hypothetical protein
VGTIIVIVTLVYLARQVRLNTVTNRIAGITGIADASRETHFTLASDRDTARVFLVGISNPDEIDRGRFELFMWGVPRQMESRHVQYEHGIISKAAMKAYPRLSVELISPNKIMQEHWKDTADYSPAFKSWIDEQVAQLGQTHK